MGLESIGVLDLNFMGHAGAIACGMLEGAGGILLVDPGPASTLANLRAALGPRGRSLADVTAILATHIHLDHFGAAGTIVRENPGVQVYVHERGAPHVIDPSRLLASAERLYGDRMEKLWGEVAAVPSTNVHSLRGEERLEIAGREIQVAYTPGHAVHHVSYFDVVTRTAFTGDVGGMRVGGVAYAMPPTPPPDIDIESWEASVERIRRWRPERLFLAHFGLVESPAQHLTEFVENLRWLARAARESLDQDGTDAERAAGFTRTVGAGLRQRLSDEDAGYLERAFPLEDSWRGLARYWRGRREREE